jgi:uncharacterized protein (TIGR02217 family)
VTTFVETPRFPDRLSYWMGGGRGFNTSIVETAGGNEFRNAIWQGAKGEWTIRGEALSTVVANSQNYFLPLRNLFLTCMWRLYAFRMKDFRDFQDDGGGVFVLLTATTFQMYKSYTVSPNNYLQIIQKPVVGTVVVTGGVSPSVDYTTGIVTVASGTPTSWTGQFDVPVRFDSDIPLIGPDTSGAMYDWQSLRLKEVRNP